MPQAVYILWAILLVVVILATPLLVLLLHRTLMAARGIERYFAEMLTAGLGIAGNTENVKALEDTIQTAVTILNKAGEINEHSEIIKKTLAARAAASNGH